MITAEQTVIGTDPKTARNTAPSRPIEHKGGKAAQIERGQEAGTHGQGAVHARKVPVQQEQFPAAEADQQGHESQVGRAAGPHVGGRLVQHRRHGGDGGPGGEVPDLRNRGPQRTGARPDAGRARHEKHVPERVGPDLVRRAVQQVGRIAGQEQQQGQAPPAAVGRTRPAEGDEVEEQQQGQIDHRQGDTQGCDVKHHVVAPRSARNSPILRRLRAAGDPSIAPRGRESVTTSRMRRAPGRAGRLNPGPTALW